MYSLFKPILFLFDPEKIHRLTLLSLKLFPFSKKKIYTNLKNKVFGLNFSSPIGLAAGFDKDAEVFDKLFNLGFGFVEVGTVTPEFQEGNKKPRIFRIKNENGVINSLGFNSSGFEFVKNKLLKNKINSILGINIGANKNSVDFIKDYLDGIKFFSNYASYITINISSPNTPGLRDLQIKESFINLIDEIKKIRINDNSLKKIPLLIKISPDINKEDLKSLCDTILLNPIDGIIISNTTLQRPYKGYGDDLNGGLSGNPLYEISTQQLKLVYEYTKGKIPLIGVGGVDSAEKAYEKIKNGASLIQLYTGMIYQGPGLVNKINKKLSILIEEDGFDNIFEAIGVNTEIK